MLAGRVAVPMPMTVPVGTGARLGLQPGPTGAEPAERSAIGRARIAIVIDAKKPGSIKDPGRFLTGRFVIGRPVMGMFVPCPR